MLEFQQIFQAIGKLPEEQRAAIRWSLVGYSVDEISARLGVGADRAQSSLYSARTALAAILHLESE